MVGHTSIYDIQVYQKNKVTSSRDHIYCIKKAKAHLYNHLHEVRRSLILPNTTLHLNRVAPFWGPLDPYMELTLCQTITATVMMLCWSCERRHFAIIHVLLFWGPSVEFKLVFNVLYRKQETWKQEKWESVLNNDNKTDVVKPLNGETNVVGQRLVQMVSRNPR